ncbi:MAG: hypothetical protein COZ06_37025 [Armatimonadetes bacterium CG_4_10_14_3_um_filter_66_18]|nr:hypothetical protein [Armatimonadota bacterium]OIP05819.1 MAG: hypothetical protein AUJ96_10065 [Armatimonadetes bacterium CG2_30_66_41]PIU93344.1 MAG: hypothetical protein COS65_13265 [Armatimonadetes bacterium CG06_land_8_20_14_3_00_66_21]PIX40375.1 MAG: hypothetical protein COZ57_26115 [Armatimonadetes bacterium CG_4_8_14_3_um_filter_66_20]PIY36050.1 MAG: hypothetical protein COZ06_37025 [Armatimonadetes bacterium CG_4_10_14_3_um_filter_66_18]PIZ44505.1 MAG: hypothetical protein COY42_13
MKARTPLDLVLSSLRTYGWLIVGDTLAYELDEDADALYLSGRLTFIGGTALTLGLAVFPGSVRYRFHCSRPDGTLIFRYDNSPHHPQLATFPHHRHTPAGVGEAPGCTLSQVLAEVLDFILGEGNGATGGDGRDKAKPSEALTR